MKFVNVPTAKEIITSKKSNLKTKRSVGIGYHGCDLGTEQASLSTNGALE
jgi:hypothetical protein